MKTLETGGNLICPNTGYIIHLPSVLDSMAFVKPVWSRSGIALNMPCHVVWGSEPGDEGRLVMEHLSNGWVVGIGNELNGSAPELGITVGMKSFLSSEREIRWGVFIPNRHYHLLNVRHFMDYLILFTLQQCGLDPSSKNERTVLANAMNAVEKHALSVFNHFGDYVNPANHQTVGEIPVVVSGTGEMRVQKRMTNGLTYFD